MQRNNPGGMQGRCYRNGAYHVDFDDSSIHCAIHESPDGSAVAVYSHEGDNASVGAVRLESMPDMSSPDGDQELVNAVRDGFITVGWQEADAIVTADGRHLTRRQFMESRVTGEVQLLAHPQDGGSESVGVWKASALRRVVRTARTWMKDVNGIVGSLGDGWQVTVKGGIIRARCDEGPQDFEMCAIIPDSSTGFFTGVSWDEDGAALTSGQGQMRYADGNDFTFHVANMLNDILMMRSIMICDEIGIEGFTPLSPGKDFRDVPEFLHMTENMDADLDTVLAGFDDSGAWEVHTSLGHLRSLLARLVAA